MVATPHPPPHASRRWCAPTLTLVACLLAACASTGSGRGSAPAWMLDPGHGLDETRTLVGVGEAPGSGPQAATIARHQALSTLVEQIVASVRADTTTRQLETINRTLDDGSYSESIENDDRKDREVNIRTELDVVGVDYELATTEGSAGAFTYARALIDRRALASHFAEAAREGITSAQADMETAISRLALGRPTDEGTAQGLEALARAGAALREPGEILPVVAAIRPPAGSDAGMLAARYPTLRAQIASRTADAAARLQLLTDTRGVTLSLGSQATPLKVTALWDDQPIPRLSLAARSGAAQGPVAYTDEHGVALVSMPPLDPEDPTVTVGPASSVATALATAVDLPFPERGTARVRVVAEDYQTIDGRTLPLRPAPSAAAMSEMLVRLGFPVIGSISREAPVYELRVRSTGAASSNNPTGGGRTLHWSRVEVTAELVDLASGEMLSVTQDAKDAGLDTGSAASKALKKALDALADPGSATSLASALARRFR